jgi:AcrR family transcriptional regulator
MTTEPIPDRVLDVATRLFASLGYDGTSARLIAESAGVDLAALGPAGDAKRDLYLAVMERVHEAERAALETSLSTFTPDRAGILRLVDGYLDFCLDYPEVPALWMHRWLSDATDVVHLERRYLRPLLTLAVGRVATVAPDDVDAEMATWMIIWCIHGFLQGGIMDAEGNRRRGEDRQALTRFRAHLRNVVTRMLWRPGPPEVTPPG